MGLRFSGSFPPPEPDDEKSSPIYHDDALTDELDVPGIVGRQKHSLTPPPRLLAGKNTDRPPRRNIEADGRFVEKEQFRSVKQTCRDLATHPLAERELSNRLVQNICKTEPLNQFA